MNFPADLKYTESHEWVRVEADGTLTIGITDHAQDALGDIVFLELPEVGKSVGTGDALAVVESVKAASDIYAPVAGEVIAVNDWATWSRKSCSTDAERAQAAAGGRPAGWWRRSSGSSPRPARASRSPGSPW